MTAADQIKILDIKILQNKAQYDLDRKAAKISALSSDDLDKYEYLTGEDLNYKPSTVEQARFEYSPLGTFFNKELKEDDKKEGLLKRLKNIEDKNEEQLRAIKNKTENIKEITDFVEELLSLKAKGLMMMTMMMMMMMMMMICFCGMVNRRKAFSLISSRDHCQRSSPSRISDTPSRV